MFIPRGEIIHENLATSYVLVDGLVADLCEGGFSGIVEVVLRDTDSFIVIASGDVRAVVEKHGDQARNGSALPYTRTTIEDLAERSRRERGRVSIYGYSAATATAVAGRINAQPLYVALSTEFTDLEKMISKLVRERDREWFIELSTEDGTTALIHMRDDECRIVGRTGDADKGPLDLANNAALGTLLDDCNRSGGTFDVYFGGAAEMTSAPAIQAPLKTIGGAPTQAAAGNGAPVESTIESVLRAQGESLPSDLFVRSSQQPWSLKVAGSVSPSREKEAEIPPAAQSSGATAETIVATSAENLSAGSPSRLGEAQQQALLLVREELPQFEPDSEAMTETKRLMGEIARVIEEAAQAVGRPDSFSMSLRAGQLSVADRFPFLDPFAGDFEYLAGEIVFVGRATVEEFVAGLTEALRFATESVARTTAYADRFRAYVGEDLHKLFARERADFQKLGLDKVLEQIVAGR
jgi:hypothetical protein